MATFLKQGRSISELKVADSKIKEIVGNIIKGI